MLSEELVPKQVDGLEVIKNGLDKHVHTFNESVSLMVNNKGLVTDRRSEEKKEMFISILKSEISLSDVTNMFNQLDAESSNFVFYLSYDGKQLYLTYDIDINILILSIELKWLLESKTKLELYNYIINQIAEREVIKLDVIY